MSEEQEWEYRVVDKDGNQTAGPIDSERIACEWADEDNDRYRDCAPHRVEKRRINKWVAT